MSEITKFPEQGTEPEQDPGFALMNAGDEAMRIAVDPGASNATTLYEQAAHFYISATEFFINPHDLLDANLKAIETYAAMAESPGLAPDLQERFLYAAADCHDNASRHLQACNSGVEVNMDDVIKVILSESKILEVTGKIK